MTLSELGWGKAARVVRVDGGHQVRSRLSQLGIHPGDELRVSSGGAFHGPLLVEIHGSRVALGRGVADRIVIEPSPADGTLAHASDPSTTRFPRQRGRWGRRGRRG